MRGMLQISHKLSKKMSRDFHFVFVLSFSFIFSIFGVSTAHDQKAHFVTSSVVTSQKWNLRFQIGQVLQFYVHYISAKYHTFRFNSLGGEVFGSFDFLIGHKRVTWLFTNKMPIPKFSWSQVLLPVLISVSCL